MFEAIEMAPADPILGLTEAFNNDPNPNKINLSVGVYKNNDGLTPILPVVAEAEKRLLASEKSKAYKPITGDPTYGKLVQQLLFGAQHDLIRSGRAVTAHTPGGTGALRVAADYIKKLHPQASIWLSNPTWANHQAIFKSAGIGIKSYPYLNEAQTGLDFDAMTAELSNVQPGDVVLLHGCCHNPTGVDLSLDQWTKIGQQLNERGAVALVDFAYQGFAEGLREDAAGLMALVDEVEELFICSSFSKNFGLYNERTGALTIVTQEASHAASVISQVKICVRTNYSNPPAHGGAIVTTVLSDPELFAQWEQQVSDMRQRINGLRGELVEQLKAKGVEQDFSFIRNQRGMFSFSRLTREQVETLRQTHSIYIVGSGRINVAGITASNIDALCEAIAGVL